MDTIQLNGAPNMYTIGQVGQHYIDMNTGKEYCCVETHPCTVGLHLGETHYIWKPVYDADLMPSNMGSGGVSSWNDLTDKPFGEGFVAFVPETVIAPFIYDGEEWGNYTFVLYGVTLEDGEIIKVVLNGIEYFVALSEKEIYETGKFWVYLGSDYAEVSIHSSMISNGTCTISMSKEGIVKLDADYIDDGVAKYGQVGEVVECKWDGNTDGLDTFMYNGENYYKVSDVVVPYNHLAKISCVSRNASSEDEIEDITKHTVEGENCYSSWQTAEFLVVYQAGAGAHRVGNTPKTFTAPSSGVYFYGNTIRDGTFSFTKSITFDTRRENSILYLNNPSGVKYAITVSDDGTLTATEVTE